jgi:glycosyltransferase involved in cell wall biosynthesis
VRILVNALSVSNQSGRHVLLGHLAEIQRVAGGRHQFVILHHRANEEMRAALGGAAEWHRAPAATERWWLRAVWESAFLPRLARRLSADVVFSPAGVTVATLRIPQVCFCQNPWCLVPSLKRTAAGRVKAALQRHAYRAAVHQAAAMVFNSHYMLEAYSRNAGCAPAHSVIAYQAISEATHEAASRAGGPRVANQIVSVSAMAPHKGAETLVQAIGVLRQQFDCACRLVLVGGWPDRSYERKVREAVRQQHLEDLVRFAGHVPEDELHGLYASSRLFCLMSRCESFGIPAVEAQAFGTPVVSSNCCAIPEICGEGGVYRDPDDVRGTANAIHELMSSQNLWEKHSQAARRNAAHYRWSESSLPMLEVFDSLGERAGGYEHPR